MINSLDDYIASQKQKLPFCKTGATTTIAQFPFSVINNAGTPGAGVLPIGNTAAGIVPVDGNGGYPNISAFSGPDGFLSGIQFSSTVASRLTIYDRLFACGAYDYNADVTLANQPSFASRVPNLDYNGLELWVETVIAPTGNLAVQVNYLDQNGDAGDTGAVGIAAAPTIKRCWQLPFASGDFGIQKITRVRGSVATVGAACFNVMVLRPLMTINIPLAGYGDEYDMLKTGLPRIYANSALYVLVTANSTSSGIPYLLMEIANK